MKRILMLICRLWWRIPGWVCGIMSREKNKDSIPYRDRFEFIQKMICKINEKSRIDIHIYGQENLPEKSGYLLTPNHQGLADALVLFEAHKEPFKAVMKQELLSTFMVKNVLNMLDFVAIDRNNLRTSMRVIKQVTREMQEGMTYLIFPEGTRSKNGNQLLEFKGGSFKPAIDCKTEIVPVALIDCYQVFDNNTIKPGHAQIHFLKPLTYDEYKDMSSQEIAEFVKSKIEDCIQQNENKFSH